MNKHYENYSIFDYGRLYVPNFGERSDHAKNEYAGSHGMAIFSAPNGEVFAHHLSLYSKPHDYQIIYKIGVANEVKTS